jgi:hypothetical protein
VGRHVQGVAGAVVEPADDLDSHAGPAVGAGESVMSQDIGIARTYAS